MVGYNASGNKPGHRPHRQHHRPVRLFHVLLTLAYVSLVPTAAACTIPVFRYALDRWEADLYQLTLPATTAADPEITNLLRPLRANGTANLRIQTDANITTSARLHLPNSSTATEPIWQGELNASTLAEILDSPGRRQIVDHILSGDSIIWVLATDGSPESLATQQRIEKRLRFLQQVAALPLQNPNDPDSQLGPGPPLTLRFTTLTLNLNDPAEQPLLRMLIGSNVKIPTHAPFASAVFGRGRVLGSWPFAEVDDQVLEDVSLFLVGRCSCRVKEQNPGWDILLNIDWDHRLRGVSAQATGLPEVADSSRPETIAITPEPSSERPPTSSRHNTWLLLAAFLVIVVSLAAKRRRATTP